MTILVNRAKMTTATTGTGTITLGSPVAGYQSFADAGVTNGQIVRYVIEDGNNWEIGTGTYTSSGTTLSRTVNESSNADAAISLSGTAQVYITAAAADILQPDNNLSDLANTSTARTNLGLAIGTNVQAYDAGLQSISGLTTSANQMIYTTASDTYATTSLTAAGRAILDDADASAQRTTLGLAIGTNVQAYDADLAAIAGLAATDGNFIVGDGTTWVAENGATARTSLGLGSIATQASNSVSITGGSITGITDLAVADGGTGASDAATARTNLGLAIGTNVQAYDAGLESISGLTTAADRMIYTTAADTYAVTTLTAAGRAILDDADAAAQRTTLGLVIGTNVQAYDADLAAIAGLAVTDGNFIVGNGTTWVAESNSTARTSLGLGSIATQAANNVSISGGSITGITDLAVADGGTGVSTVPTNGQLLIGNGTGYTVANLTAGSGVSITNASGSITITSTGSGGTVTSVSGTGTVNGLTLTGTVTTSGNLTLGGTLAISNADWSGTDLAIANGGTGASDSATARTNLGLAIGTNVQAYDAGLQSIAGLTTVADRMIYTTASDTYAVTTLTAAGRAILDDADASAQRTTLGLAIGTNVQAYDADLDALAALATNGMIARTGAGTVAARTITAGTGISITNGNGVSGNPTISSTTTGTVTSITAGTGLSGGTITTSGTISLASSSQMTTANVLGATAGASAGAVGTYAWLGRLSSSAAIAEGDTIAGSSLKFNGITSTNDYGTAAWRNGANTPSGTWRAMGGTVLDNTNTAKATLFLRIS